MSNVVPFCSVSSRVVSPRASFFFFRVCGSCCAYAPSCLPTRVCACLPACLSSLSSSHFSLSCSFSLFLFFFFSFCGLSFIFSPFFLLFFFYCFRQLMPPHPSFSRRRIHEGKFYRTVIRSSWKTTLVACREHEGRARETVFFSRSCVG